MSDKKRRTTRLTKLSAPGKFIDHFEQERGVKTEIVGKIILTSIARLYTERDAPIYDPTVPHKYKVIDSIHRGLHQIYMDIILGRFDEHIQEFQLEPFARPNIQTLEGVIEQIRNSRGDEFFSDMRNITYGASNAYYLSAATPYEDKWKMYDLMQKNGQHLLSRNGNGKHDGGCGNE